MTWNKKVAFVLRKRNVGLGVLKLNLVFLYYKVQTAVLLGLSQRTTPCTF